MTKNKSFSESFSKSLYLLNYNIIIIFQKSQKASQLDSSNPVLLAHFRYERPNSARENGEVPPVFEVVPQMRNDFVPSEHSVNFEPLKKAVKRLAPVEPELLPPSLCQIGYGGVWVVPY